MKPAADKDWDAAIAVAWTTFRKDAAKFYTQEGIDNFREGLVGTQLYIDFLQGKFPLFCAYCGSKVIGMLALRDNHISLFFVKREFQRKGIGTRLLQACKNHCEERRVFDLTVNASPLGLPFYLARGFQIISEERLEGGLRYTPMMLKA